MMVDKKVGRLLNLMIDVMVHVGWYIWSISWLANHSEHMLVTQGQTISLIWVETTFVDGFLIRDGGHVYGSLTQVNIVRIIWFDPSIWYSQYSGQRWLLIGDHEDTSKWQANHGGELLLSIMVNNYKNCWYTFVMIMIDNYLTETCRDLGDAYLLTCWQSSITTAGWSLVDQRLEITRYDWFLWINDSFGVPSACFRAWAYDDGFRSIQLINMAGSISRLIYSGEDATRQTWKRWLADWFTNDPGIDWYICFQIGQTTMLLKNG